MNPKILRPAIYAPAESEGGSGAGDTPGKLAQAKQSITNTARDTAARIKSAANETASRAKIEAQRVASDTKETAANRLGGYSSAFHESAKSFEEQDPNVAWATHRIADRVQSFADYVRNSDLNDLRTDAESFARRHPVAFFGGLMVAGLVVGNLLKARRPMPESDTDMMDETSTAESESMIGDPNADVGNASGSSEEPAMPPSEPAGM